MATSKQLHYLATNPLAFRRFQATGELPATVRPRSPLIDLLEKLSPRDRCAIVGLTVDPALGYSGSRMFPSAEAALRWARPDTEMLRTQSWPARSWQDKRFLAPLTLDTLLVKASRFPPQLPARYPHLLGRARPSAPQPRKDTPAAGPGKDICGAPPAPQDGS